MRQAQPELLTLLVNGDETPESKAKIKAILTILGVDSKDLDAEYDKLTGKKLLTAETATTHVDALEDALLETAVDTGDKATVMTILANKGALAPGFQVREYN